MSVKNQLEPVLCPGQPPESLRRDISGFTRIHTFMVVFLSLSKNYHVCNISFTLTHQIMKASKSSPMADLSSDEWPRWCWDILSKNLPKLSTEFPPLKTFPRDRLTLKMASVEM